MKPEVRAWKTKAKEYIPKIKAHEELEFFEMNATFYYPFFYKNGKVKKVDTQNLLKVLIDAIAEKCGFDDALLKFGSWSSYHADTENVEVELKQVKVMKEDDV